MLDGRMHETMPELPEVDPTPCLPRPTNCVCAGGGRSYGARTMKGVCCA